MVKLLPGTSNKRQQLPYSLAEPDATEVFDGNLRGTVDDVSARLQEGLSELLQGV